MTTTAHATTVVKLATCLVTVQKKIHANQGVAVAAVVVVVAVATDVEILAILLEIVLKLTIAAKVAVTYSVTTVRTWGTLPMSAQTKSEWLGRPLPVPLVCPVAAPRPTV